MLQEGVDAEGLVCCVTGMCLQEFGLECSLSDLKVTANEEGLIDYNSFRTLMA